jgi:DNA-binding transcriptional MerR regulator
VNVSELARRAGLLASGVRWYESEGILPVPARGGNGYRVYSDTDLGRLTLILTLRRLGLKPDAAGAIARKSHEPSSWPWA